MLENIRGYGQTLEAKLAQSNAQASAVSQRSYQMARMHRLSKDWESFVKSFNYDISAGGNAMLARAQDLRKNDPYARKILRLLEKNVVGPKGFLFRNKSGEYQRVGNETRFVFDKLANLKIEEGFWDWGRKENCTVSGQVSFRRLCQQAISTVWCDGEIFFKMKKGKSAGKYGFKLQPIESMYVDYALTREFNGNFIVMGVELNADRKPVAYWFRDNSAKVENRYGFVNSKTYKRIEAGQIIHLFIQETTNQVRGITQFAPAGLRMKMLYDFEQNSLMRSKASSRVPGVIQKQPNQNSLEGPGVTSTAKDTDGNWIVELEEGEFLKMADGYEMKVFESDYPHPLQASFTKSNLRSITAGSDVGYSSVSNDYESVTWHSGKLEKADERDGFRDMQEWMTENFLEPVNYHWLEMALLSSDLNLPAGDEKLKKFFKPTFLGRGWDYTNPKEEMGADIEGLAAGINTMETVLAKRGIDLDEHFDQLAREAEKKKEFTEKYGVQFIWVKPQSAPAPQDDNNNDDDKKNNTNKEFEIPLNGNGKH